MGHGTPSAKRQSAERHRCSAPTAMATSSCAAGDQCCGDTCVSKDDVCCENVLGNSFPCQGNGGGCCGNACYAPGSKCCKSPWVAKARWYPVTKATKCAW